MCEIIRTSKLFANKRQNSKDIMDSDSKSLKFDYSFKRKVQSPLAR